MSVQDIITFVAARVGLCLAVKSASDTISSYYPDFIIQPGDRGDNLIKRLLSFVPDVIFIEGSKAYLVNPAATDRSVYAYGVAIRYLKAIIARMKGCPIGYRPKAAIRPPVRQ